MQGKEIMIIGIAIVILGAMLPVSIAKIFEGSNQGTEPEMPDPVAWWKLDEAPGSTSFADSAGSNTGACVGAGCPTSGGAGHFGTSVDFDATDDVITTTFDPDPVTFSISAWVNWGGTPSPDSQRYIMTKRVGNNEWELRVLNDGTASFNGWSSNPALTVATEFVPGVVPIGEWANIVVTNPGRFPDLVAIYVNGEFVSEGLKVSGEIQDTPDFVRIGAGNDLDRVWDGGLDDIRFYDQGLTPSQIQILAGTHVTWSASTLAIYAALPIAIIAIVVITFVPNRKGE